MAVAVEPGGVLDLGRHPLEPLPDEERAERRRPERRTSHAFELTQRSVRMVCTLASSVTSRGSSRVPRVTANSRFLSGKRRKANAAPAMIAVTNWATVIMVVTVRLRTRAGPRLPLS